MVMTSDQISAMAGNFQAQNMGQMQHAAMISQQVGGQSSGQQMMGGMVNKASAIGGPMATLGMGMAGLDPMSMGLKGAMAGSRMGAMGAIGGGMMGAGAVAAPMMAAQYVGGQMMQGMSQQQQVGGALGQSFQFANRQGGKGFTGGQQGQIGEFLRTQTNKQGAGGEMQTMGELTRMTSMMGQMGMGGGVRNVKQFTEKFSKMMKEVKEIAGAFNTTLEEAQQIMGSMRDSGINKNQGQVAQQVRQYALAGGLATQEITSAMNVGSQISGAIGGKRGSGAMAGMKTIGMIGMAQTTGVLTDDDVFQQTGQRGAAGRAQMAQQSMSRSAGFLKSGLGRRILASMAGKNGELDEQSAEEFENGGVGTGKTMGMAHKNLGKVGRANFVRNEGRLRGEVLKKFGGNADVMAMAGWMEGRGKDTSSDRSRIFMQRKLKMSSDELNNAMKVYDKKDFIESQMEGATAQADQSKRIQIQKGGAGLKGIKKKFEKSRNDVQNYLQQKGADFYNEGANLVDRWANELTGQFMTDMQENLESDIRAVRQGGVMGRHIGAKKFGLGEGMGKGIQNLADKYQKDMMGEGSGMSNVQAFKQSGDLKRMRESGYNIKAGGSDAQLATNLRGIRGLQSAFQEGSEDDRYGELGSEVGDMLSRQTAVGNIGGRGTDFTASFTETMERQGGKAGMVGAQLSTASNKGRMKVAGSMMRGAGLGKFGANRTGMPERQSLFGTSNFRTTEDRNTAIGEYALGRSGTKEQDAFLNQKVAGEATRGKLIGAMAAGVGGLVGMGGTAGNWAEKKYESVVRGTDDTDKQAYGDELMSTQTQDRMKEMLSKDKGVAGDATEQTFNDMRKLQLNDNRSETENARLEVNRSMLVAQDFAKLASKMGPQAAAEELAKGSKDQYGKKMTASEVEARGGSTLGSMGDTQKSARRQLFRRAQEMGSQEAATYRKGGMYKGGAMTGKFSAELAEAAGGKGQEMSFEGDEAAQAAAAMGGVQKGASSLDAKDGKFSTTATGGQMYMGGMMRAAVLEEGIVEGGGAKQDKQNRAKIEEAMKSREGARLGLSKMGNEELRNVAAVARKRGDLGSARALKDVEQLRNKMGRAGKGLRGDVTIAKQMGSSVKAEDLRGMSEEGMASAITKDLLGEKMANTEAGKLFMEGKEGKGGMQEIIKLQREGKTDEAADALSVLRGSSGGLVQKGKESKDDAAAKKDDPSYRKLDAMAGSLKTLAADIAGKELQVNGLARGFTEMIAAIKA